MNADSLRTEIRPNDSRLDVIEAQTMNWDKIIVDRTEELTSWVDFCYQIMKRGVLILAYANNHFAGHGPATIEVFQEYLASEGPRGADSARAEATAAIIAFSCLKGFPHGSPNANAG